jgi:hypothetical protein
MSMPALVLVIAGPRKGILLDYYTSPVLFSDKRRQSKKIENYFQQEWRKKGQINRPDLKGSLGVDRSYSISFITVSENLRNLRMEFSQI